MPFHQLSDIPPPEATEEAESTPQTLNVIPETEAEIEWATLELKLTQPAIIKFNKSIQHECSRIVVEHTKVTFIDMNLLGWVNSHGANINFKNCTISGKDRSTDYLISVSNNGVCEIHDCVLKESKFYGVGVDDESVCRMERTTVSDCGEPVVAVFNSWCTINNCKLKRSKADLVVVEHGQLTMSNTTLSHAECFAMFLYEMTESTITDCTFRDNTHGAVSIRNSRHNKIISSVMRDSNDTSVLLEESSVLLDRVKIMRCNGNGVNVQDRSHVVIENCEISETKWPSAAFCGGSHAFVRNTIMEKSEMSGFVVRDDSQVHVTHSIVRNCVEDGARICDSRNVVCDNTIFSDCGYNGAVCDGAVGEFIDCTFSGGFESAITVYCGSFAMGRNITILSPMKQAIWVHLGGSAHFSGVLIHPGIQKPLKVEYIRGLVGQLRLKQRLDRKTSISQTLQPGVSSHPSIRIETKWSVIITNSYIVGTGNYELFSNVSAMRNSLERIPAKCLVCGNPATNHYFSPCGHCLYCKPCWDGLEVKPTHCNLCHFPIGVAAPGVNCGSDDTTCSICFADEIDSVFLPCGHLVCKACAVKWLEYSRECPFCRSQGIVRRPISTYE